MARPGAYLRGSRPTLAGGDMPFVMEELRRIEVAFREVSEQVPQPAIIEPTTRRDGMIRLARAPWRPVGGDADVWVYFDGPANIWKPL
ncbi:hypothetical protein [Roseomonas sp. WA12]